MPRREATVKTTMRINDGALLALVDEGQRRALMRLGGFIRVTAQRSMRRVHPKSGKASPPGEPPRARIGFIRLKVEFGYDTRMKRLVVGPEQVRRSNSPNLPKWELGVPNLMEFGGQVRVGPDGWWILGWKGKKKSTLRLDTEAKLEPGTIMHFPPRPYMKPAFDKAVNQEKLKQFWEALN